MERQKKKHASCSYSGGKRLNIGFQVQASWDFRGLTAPHKLLLQQVCFASCFQWKQPYSALPSTTWAKRKCRQSSGKNQEPTLNICMHATTCHNSMKGLPHIGGLLCLPHHLLCLNAGTQYDFRLIYICQNTSLNALIRKQNTSHNAAIAQCL